MRNRKQIFGLGIVVALTAAFSLTRFLPEEPNQEEEVIAKQASDINVQASVEPERSSPDAEQQLLLENDRVALPPQLRSIFGDARYPHGASGRVYRLSELAKNNPSPELLEFVDSFLLDPVPPVEVSQFGLPVLKNEAMNYLREHSADPWEVARTLRRIFEDSRHPLVIRDYAVQHLGETYLRLPPGFRRSLLPTFLEATNQTEGSVAGTALLALRRFAEEDALEGEVSRRDVKDIALALASNDSLPASDRLTAVQVSARLGDHRLLDVARDYAMGGEDITLRSVSIAALAELGDRRLKAEIASLRNHPDIRIQAAASAALEKIKATQQF